MLSESKLIADLSLPTRDGSISGKFAIYIDLEANGYYLLSSEGLSGPMALAPDSSRTIRVINSPERNHSIISEFELRFPQ